MTKLCQVIILGQTPFSPPTFLKEDLQLTFESKNKPENAYFCILGGRESEGFKVTFPWCSFLFLVLCVCVCTCTRLCAHAH